jgi:hypothetical protein
MDIELLFLMSVWGATHIIVSSKLFQPVRDWFLVELPKIYEILNCYQCSGFWVSAILFYFFDLPQLSKMFFYIHLDFLFWGFIGSGFCSVVSFVISRLLLIKDI